MTGSVQWRWKLQGLTIVDLVVDDPAISSLSINNYSLKPTNRVSAGH